MGKKFTFNFKFLERFKKKSVLDDLPSEDSEDFSNFQEMKYQSFKQPEENEFDTAEHTDEFAEKTLSNFKMPDLNEKHNIEFPPLPETETEPVTNFEFNEFPPKKPDAKAAFKFNFQSFGKNTFSNLNSKKSNFKNSLNKMEKISWNDFVLKFFSPYSRTKVHNVFTILLVITITYLLGKSVAMFANRTSKIDLKTKSNIIVQETKQDSTISDLNKITSSNLFNAKESEEVKAKGPKINISQIVCLDADRPTSMQIKLLDTIVLQDSIKSVASVQVRGSTDLLNIREGEKVENSEISKISRMKLILKNLETGDCEYLASEREDEAQLQSPIKVLPASAGAAIFKSMNPNILNVGNSFKIKRKYRDEMLTKMSDVLTQAKAIQITNPDGSLCFKMTEIVPGSIYSSLNIQDSDIICQVNGRKIDNLNELMGMLSKMKDIDAMQIGLKRNGMQENLDYNFE